MVEDVEESLPTPQTPEVMEEIQGGEGSKEQILLFRLDSFPLETKRKTK